VDVPFLFYCVQAFTAGILILAANTAFKELARTTDRPTRRRIRRCQAINATGAFFTGIVLVIVLTTKFLHGAWIATMSRWSPMRVTN
jgi:hypothetical protein